MQAELFFSYDTLQSNASRVRDIYRWLNYSINASSDLGLYLKAVDVAMALKVDVAAIPDHLQTTTLKAMRVMNLILEADPLQDSDVMLLWRIAKKSLEHGKSKSSIGLDAAWELDMLTHVRFRGITAKIAEPDIKVVIADMEYSIACKRVNVETGLENLIEDGCEQLARHGAGVIAINLDILADDPAPLDFDYFIDGERHGQRLIDNFLLTQREKLYEYIEKHDNLDGFLLSVSCATRIKESHADLDLCTASRYLDNPNGVSYTAVSRFRIFYEAMRRN
jgi:hypothetical protein